jgi:hypothetical protein
MKGYKRIHGIAHCEECDWQEEGYLICIKEAEKHHKDTGHKIAIELGFYRSIE